MLEFVMASRRGGKTLQLKAVARLVRADRGQLEPEFAALEALRPRVRADCRQLPRPCLFASCRYHLAVDVSRAGGLRLAHPDQELWELAETCALDVAERGGLTLEEVGALVNLTRGRVHQIEQQALRKVGEELEGGPVERKPGHRR